MSQKKIIKNVSGEAKQILRRGVEDQSQYDISPHFWTELAINSSIHSLVVSGDYVVNNGDLDLPPS